MDRGCLALLLVAACALIDADKRVLIAQRPEGKPMAGLWEFPGGKVEDGETPEDTVIRELVEELAVTVTKPCLAPLSFASHNYREFHILMPLFVCRRWEGSPVPIGGPAAEMGSGEPASRLSHAACRRTVDQPSG